MNNFYIICDTVTRKQVSIKESAIDLQYSKAYGKFLAEYISNELAGKGLSFNKNFFYTCGVPGNFEDKNYKIIKTKEDLKKTSRESDSVPPPFYIYEELQGDTELMPAIKALENEVLTPSSIKEDVIDRANAVLHTDGILLIQSSSWHEGRASSRGQTLLYHVLQTDAGLSPLYDYSFCGIYVVSTARKKVVWADSVVWIGGIDESDMKKHLRKMIDRFP